MARVTIHLPALLANLVGERTVAVDALSVAGALAELSTRHPSLAHALFDERGILRTHVLCFHNQENTRWHAEGLHRKLAAGDRLTILQAVAGG